MEKNSGYFRRRTIIITDQRVTLMKELLTCVKLIKMYAWEKPFSKTISGIWIERQHNKNFNRIFKNYFVWRHSREGATFTRNVGLRSIS